MNAHETTATWNIAETCVHSLTLDELLEMSGDADGVVRRLRETWLGYGDIVGSPRLRAAIAALYGERITPDNVLTANGAIGANFLALYALVEPGTTVVSVQPTYQQLYSVPESLGAEVREVRLREEDGYLPDPDASARRRRAHRAHRPEQPQQPDGGTHRRAAAARDRGGGARARRLAVLRRGVPEARARAGDDGAVGRRPVREGRQQRQHEQELLARRPAHRLGRRPGGDHRSAAWTCATTRPSAPACSTTPSRPWRSSTSTRCSAAASAIVRGNLAVVDEWIAREPRLRYVRPRAGTIALVRYDLRRALGGLLPGALRPQRRLRHAGRRLRRGARVPARVRVRPRRARRRAGGRVRVPAHAGADDAAAPAPDRCRRWAWTRMRGGWRSADRGRA